jgi:hypothetical protein
VTFPSYANYNIKIAYMQIVSVVAGCFKMQSGRESQEIDPRRSVKRLGEYMGNTAPLEKLRFFLKEIT